MAASRFQRRHATPGLNHFWHIASPLPWLCPQHSNRWHSLETYVLGVLYLDSLVTQSFKLLLPGGLDARSDDPGGKPQATEELLLQGRGCWCSKLEARVVRAYSSLGELASGQLLEAFVSL